MKQNYLGKMMETLVIRKYEHGKSVPYIDVATKINLTF